MEQVIYLSDQHRNPTVSTLEQGNGWCDLEARHGGLNRVKNRLQRSAKGDAFAVPANCSRIGVLNALRDKNIPGADTANLICGTCIAREACINANGPGYGFLNQRRNVLGAPLLRAHPDSLPDPEDYPLENTMLIWDEPGQNFQVKQSTTVTLHRSTANHLSIDYLPRDLCSGTTVTLSPTPLDGWVYKARKIWLESSSPQKPFARYGRSEAGGNRPNSDAKPGIPQHHFRLWD